MKSRLAIIGVLCALPIAAADLSPSPPNLLANGSFESTDLKGWTQALYGDRGGKITLVEDGVDGRWAARIEAPTDRSWTFLRQQDFEVALGEELVLRARVKSTSGRAKIVLTCGYVWGGGPGSHTTCRCDHSGSGEWEELHTRLRVDEFPVSAAVGFDYGCAGQTLLTDEVVLEREYDVLSRDARAVAQRYDALADLTPTLREVARSQAQKGRRLADELDKKWRPIIADSPDDKGWQRFLGHARAYVRSGRQLIVRCDQASSEEGMSAKQIHLRARKGQPATMRFTLQNLFGQHSVAARVTIGEFTDHAKRQAIGSEEIRFRQFVSATRSFELGEATTVTVPTQEACELNCTIDTSNLAPGTYRGLLTVLPLDPRQARGPNRIAVRLTVSQ